MAIMLAPKEMVLIQVRFLLNKFRFGFEKAELVVEYFPLEDKYYLMANGKYKLQFDLGWRLSDFDFKKVDGLWPVWGDPVI